MKIVAAAILAVLTSACLPRHVSADIQACETDPRIWLSDGTQIDLKAKIGASASAVTTLAYVVHIPASLAVTQVVSTGQPTGSDTSAPVLAGGSLAKSVPIDRSTATLGSPGNEDIEVIADRAAGQYSATVYVQTTIDPTTVELDGSVLGGNSASATGTTETVLSLSM
jgi:hypothetical protein